MMLPSGNDAAQVLGDNFGYILKFSKENNQDLINEIRANNCVVDYKNEKTSSEV